MYPRRINHGHARGEFTKPPQFHFKSLRLREVDVQSHGVLWKWSRGIFNLSLRLRGALSLVWVTAKSCCCGDRVVTTLTGQSPWYRAGCYGQQGGCYECKDLLMEQGWNTHPPLGFCFLVPPGWLGDVVHLREPGPEGDSVRLPHVPPSWGSLTDCKWPSAPHIWQREQASKQWWGMKDQGEFVDSPHNPPQIIRRVNIVSAGCLLSW